jgi:hypothetical protein
LRANYTNYGPVTWTVMELPAVDVPGPGGTLSFWLRPSKTLQCGSFPEDRMQVEVNGAIAYVSCTAANQWTEVVVDLSPWSGEEVVVAFRHVKNSGCCSAPSFAVDDIEIEIPCCEESADCDDGKACTADSCGDAGKCNHTPIPGCCDGSALALGFEAGSPGGWSIESGDPTRGWSVVSGGHEGAYELRANYTNYGPVTWTVMELPAVDVPGPGGTLSFWLRPSKTLQCGSFPQDRMQVEVNGAIAYVSCTAANQWTEVVVDLSPWSGEEVVVAFRHVKNSGCCSAPSFAIDDIVVAIDCP